MKKKLYWWVLQLDKIGGTEMVSTALANALCDEYDITIISSAMIGNNAYKIDPRINVISLDIPLNVMTIDHALNYYKQNKQYGRRFKLICQAIKHIVFKRNKYRKYVTNLILKDDATLICSAIDSYWMAPKKGRVLFHFHFPENVYCSFSNKFVMRHTRKPDKTIFITKATEDKVIEKFPKLKGKTTHIDNPCRFKNQLVTKNIENNLYFLGRFSKEKNPMFALEIANELKNRNFNFSFIMSGHGSLQKQMQDYINKHELYKNVKITGITKNVQETLKHYDLVLSTSLYEGFGLTLIEANSVSTPVISSDAGEGVRTVVKDGVNGYIINSWDPKDYADKIIEVLSNQRKYNDLRKSSYKHNEKYQIEAIIPHWKKILE